MQLKVRKIVATLYLSYYMASPFVTSLGVRLWGISLPDFVHAGKDSSAAICQGMASYQDPFKGLCKDYMGSTYGYVGVIKNQMGKTVENMEGMLGG